MKNLNLHSKLVLAYILLSVSSPFTFAQDSLKFNWNFDTLAPVFFPSITFPSNHSDYYICHFPQSKDSVIISKYAYLIKERPSRKNYHNYFNLACALWDLSKLKEAEKMFKNIVNSDKSFYSENYTHASDVPGDSGNIYGYGSFTSNYKNYACRYLTKIYVEQQKFDEALKYILLADKVYPVSYSCGTGNRFYQNEIDGLYGLCYEGTGKYDSVINLFLPRLDIYGNNTLVRAIRKKYSQGEINRLLADAENAMVFTRDTFETEIYTTYNSETPEEYTTVTKYFSGSAQTTLFGKPVTLPEPPLTDGETATKEHFINYFRNSYFYQELANSQY